MSTRLEFIPGRRSSERGPLGIEQVLSALHPLALQPLTFAIHASDRQVRFLLEVPDEAALWVESLLYAQYPDATSVLVPERIERKSTNSVRLRGHLGLRRTGAFPIKRHPQLVDPTTRAANDPLDVLLHALASLPTGHEATITLDLAPVADSFRKRTTAALLDIADRDLARAETATDRFLRWHLASPTLWPLARLLLPLFRRRIPLPDTSSRSVTPESSSTHERESDIQACLGKVRRHLFHVMLTLEVSAPSPGHDLPSYLDRLTGAFAQFDLPGLNGFMRSRSPSPCVLNTEEIATLWHLPTLGEMENTISPSRPVTLPPPSQLAPPSNEDIPLGYTTYRREGRAVAIGEEAKRRHLYVVGKSGVGKSTVLLNLLVGDIRRRRGVGLIDPHGDLVAELLERIPAERTNDVVLIDPADLHPVCLNPFHDPARNPPLIADAILATFMKIFATGDFGSWGPRLEDILRHSLLALAEAGGTTLLDILRLFEDGSFRDRLLRRVKDPLVLQWWRGEFPRLKSHPRDDPFASVTNKLRQLLVTPAIRNMLLQREGKLNIRRAMDEGKIILCNVSKGRFGERTSMFLGSLLVARFQLDAMSRADIPEHRRRDFHLYVDEFQNFAGPSFAEILSEARKYRLGLTLAHQFLGQIPEAMKQAVLGNVGTILAMQVGAEDAAILAEHFGPPARPEDFVGLSRYEGILRMELASRVTAPFTIATLPPEGNLRDRHRVDVITRQSRARYGTSRSKVDRMIARAL